MPINLSESEALIMPEQVIPAISADKAWIQDIRIHAPMGGVRSAVTESHPSDGVKVYRRDTDGNDTMLQVVSNNLQADMAKDSSIAIDVNAAMAAIISVTKKIKALRDAEAEALRKAQEDQTKEGSEFP